MYAHVHTHTKNAHIHTHTKKKSELRCTEDEIQLHITRTQARHGDFHTCFLYSILLVSNPEPFQAYLDTFEIQVLLVLNDERKVTH